MVMILHCSSRKHFQPLLIASMLLVFTSDSYAHKGNPWHGNGGASALGFNTVYLQPTAEGEVTQFVMRYPIQPNKLEYVMGNSSAALVIPDAALNDGVFTEEEVLAVSEQNSYDTNHPIELKFNISKSGYYHVLFGPGDGTSILVLEPNRTFEVTPTTGGTVAYVAPTTSGDMHIVKDASAGISKFAGWVGLLFDDVKADYQAKGIITQHAPPFDGETTSKIVLELSRLGQLTPEANASLGPGTYDIPFLGNVNGLGSAAVGAAFLTPGNYEFSVDLSKSPNISTVNGLSLSVSEPSALDDGFGSKSEIIAHSVTQLDSEVGTLAFKVDRSGYYRLAYGPPPGGFLMTVQPRTSSVVTVKPVGKIGSVNDLVPLANMDAILEGKIAAELDDNETIFYPAQIYDPDAVSSRNLISSAVVPLNRNAAIQVMRSSAAYIQPGVINLLKAQRDNLMLQAAPK